MSADIEADTGITTEASNWVFDEHIRKSVLGCLMCVNVTACD